MRKLLFLALVLSGLTTFGQVDLELGLVANYPFNGNANDVSGNRNNGTVYGATFTEDRFGNENSAFHFDGIDDYIQISNDSSLSKIGTIAAWVKVSDNYDEFIFDKSSNKEYRYDYRLWIGHDGDFMFRFADKSDMLHSVKTEEQVSLDTWVFVCGVYDALSNTLSIYIDGEKKVEENIDGASLRNSQMDAFIGKSQYGEYLNGDVDDLRIYNRALSEIEIMVLMFQRECVQVETVYDTVVVFDTIKVYDTITVTLFDSIGTKTGYDIVEKIEFSVSPNPAQQYLKIESESTISKVSIINMNGRTVKTETLNNNFGVINLEGMTTGNYILSVETSDGLKQQELIIKE